MPMDPRPGVQRRLAAILSADVIGYSRLVEIDEEGTIARLKTLHRELIDPTVARHNGRVVKTTGDGFLIEYASVVDAMRSAVEIQRSIAEGDGEVPEDRRLRLRIGVNLGDVVIEGDDIFGDGVNIAARLQEACRGGSVYVSQAVREQIGDRLGLDFEDLGDHTVKNLSRPIRIFAISIDGAGAGPAVSSPAPAAAAKPSIAVLPFTNMSGDAEQEFFTDGLTEDIITELSRFRDLFVIARNSTFVYKGKAVNVQEAARELGATYIVEGSARKAGNRVRVTVQLIDAESNRHIWAERYDRQLEDIFAIQDELTSAIVSVLPGRVEAAARDRARPQRTGNMAAYEYVLAGKVLHHRMTRGDNIEALRMLDQALTLDPKYAHAHAWKACTLGQAWVRGYASDRDATWQQVLTELQTALALDDCDSDVHRILAAVNVVSRNYERAQYHQQRALSLNPNDDLIVVQQGEVLTWLGQPEEGIEWILKAMRLNPYHPERYWNHLGRAYFAARRYAEAVEAFKRIATPDHTHHAFLAAATAQLGEADAAAAHARDVLRLEPGFSVTNYVATLHYRDDGDRQHHREALLKAGLPERVE
jgi:adenylate cyclase